MDRYRNLDPDDPFYPSLNLDQERQKIEQALRQAGARLSEVYRVRMYVTDISRGQEYLRAYAEFFKEIRPVIIMAEVSALPRPAHLIEIEAEAMLGSYRVNKQGGPL